MLPTSSSARTVLPPVRTLAVALCAMLGAGVVLAGPAVAIEDPRRPTAEVTHGPSCGPAVVRVLVTNGTEPHRVALVFDGGQEQGSAVVGPEQEVELGSADVDPGVTVDVSITVADLDGTAEEPLQLGTYTRPSADDCAAVSEPLTPAPAQGSGSGSSSRATSDGTAPTVPPVSGQTRPSTAPPSRPGGSTPAEDGGQTQPDAGAPTGPVSSASSASVSPGGVVTVRATGFTAGEAVTVTLAGGGEPLTTVAAAADGSVEAVVQIPRGAALGSATVQFAGGESAATAGLDLQVAARTRPVQAPTGSPAVVAAGLALVGAAGTLGLVGARRSRGRHSPTYR